MAISCCSAHRCQKVSCPACTWRYALHVTRRILACEPLRLHVLTIERAVAGPHDIERLRRSAHNAVAYQRRRYRGWRSVGVWGWYNDADFHGIVELGSISTTEFIHTFQRRGEIRLRPIEAENLRAEVYAAARSVSATSIAGGTGRYQPLKVAIEPVTTRTRNPLPTIDDLVVPPMPIML